MSFNRRSFLQMLGLGGMGIVSGSQASVPLFGSDDQPDSLWTPGGDFLSGHHVVKRKRLIEKVPERETPPRSDGAVVVARLVKNRLPPGIVNSVRSGLVSPAYASEGTVRDAHAAFYLAARDIRSQFAEKSLAFLANRENLQRESGRPWFSSRSNTTQILANGNGLVGKLSLVTIVDAEIHARPTANPDDPAGAFEVACLYEQLLVENLSSTVMQTFETYSETGDFPISIPKDVDLGLLVRTDKELLSDRQGYSRDRVSSILSKLLG